MDQGIFEISLNSDNQNAERISLLLEKCGALSITFTDLTNQNLVDQNKNMASLWDCQRISALFSDCQSADQLVCKIRSALNYDGVINVERVENQDWEKTWLSDFQPTKVGTRLWVCPSWCEPECPEDINLMINPGMAFGTGDHETTSLCLEFLSEFDLRDKAIMDIGCGSGILSIAAIKLGASRALAIDNDPKALEVAALNAILNDVSSMLLIRDTIDCLETEISQQYDLVVANILAETLIDMSHTISSVANTGGTILLSGILKSQSRSVVNAFPQWIEFTEKIRNDWVLLIGSVNQNSSLT